jgi:hypothetical protein
MPLEGWFWLILDVVLIGWFIRCVREPIARPGDGITRVPTTDEPTEGDNVADQDRP